jgi:pimeloyl-ACP methyl ester carboxylesterase
MRNITKLILAAAIAATLAGGVSLVRLDLDPVALETRYATPPSRFVMVDGVRFHVRDRGAGPAIVLVHGQSANLFGWEAWAEDLQEDHRVISLDLPGHGLTGPDPQGRYSWADLAEGIDRLTTELGIDRFVLAGNSLGGAVAVSYALAHGDRLDGLVLLDAIGAPRDEPKPLIFELYAAPVIGQAITVMTPEWMVRASLESTYGNPALVTDADVTSFSDLMRRAGNREAARQIVSQPYDPAIPARIGELSVPVLLMWGGRDSWVAPKYAHWYDTHLPNADLVIFPDLGHMPMSEAPAPTLAALRRFLAQIAA